MPLLPPTSYLLGGVLGLKCTRCDPRQKCLSLFNQTQLPPEALFYRKQKTNGQIKAANLTSPFKDLISFV